MGAAAFVNLLALDRMAGEDTSLSLGFVRLALAALVLAAGAVTLFRGPSRRPRVSRDHLAFLAAVAAFGLGVIELDLPALARLSSIGLDALALRAAHAAGFEVAVSIVLAVCLERGAAAALAHAARADIDARDRARATSARRLGADGAELTVRRAALQPGDIVRLLEGERAPVDLELLEPCRAALPGAASPWAAAELGQGARLDEGAVLLSSEVKGRVVCDRGAIAAAMDAEVRRALSWIDASAARPRPFSWSTIAVWTLLVATLCFAAFAAVLHAAADDLGGEGAQAALAAVTVIAGSSTAAFSLAAPIARGIAVLRAREGAVVVRDVEAMERLEAVDVACFDEPAAAGAIGARPGVSGAAPVVAAGTPRALWDRGVGCRLLSEGPPCATARVAHRLGIPGTAGLSPAGKARAVEELARAFRRVLIVGRGGASIPVARAEGVTVALTEGTPDAATGMDAPIIVNGGAERLPALLDGSRRLCRRMRENAAITVAYNAAVIPAAVFGLISPIQAAGLTLLETALVLANTARLFGAERPAPPRDRPRRGAPGDDAAVDCASPGPAARATISAS